MINFVKGDQFVGFNVDPNNGDLVLRYTVVATGIPDANGRGITRNVMMQNRTLSKGRPVIYAPDIIGGGTRGHTNIHSLNNDPFKYEVARIMNLQQAPISIYNDWIQTNSNMKNIVTPADLWVIDTLVPHDAPKKLWLTPATSPLIPRYASPSFIHKRRPDGDYTKVDDAVLDHVAIVNRPTYNGQGIQIDGAAYGEITKLRGACFGDKIACLNLVQTSSNNVIELDKCVSCPVQLLDRLTDLYLDVTNNYANPNSYLLQTGSSNIMSNNATNSNPNTVNDNTEVVTATTTTTTNQPQQLQQPTNTTTQPQPQPQTQSPLGAFFKNDDQLQTQYNQLKGVVQQIIKETQPNTTIIDGNQSPDQQTAAQGGGGQQQTQQKGQQTQPIAENVKTGDIPQLEQQTNKVMEELQKKLNITQDELKNMKTDDIVNRFNDLNKIVNEMAEGYKKTERTLAQIQTEKEKTRIASLLPAEAFQNERGFMQKEFEEVVNLIHKTKLPDDYVKIMGVGLIQMRLETQKVREQNQALKKNPSLLFGQSLKTQQPQQGATPNQQITTQN